MQLSHLILLPQTAFLLNGHFCTGNSKNRWINNLLIKNRMGCRVMVFVWIFAAIIQGLIWGFVAQIISENKGYEDGFFWGFFLGIMGIIVVACKPDNNSSYALALLSKEAAEEEKDKSEKELLNVQKLKSYKDLLDSGVITQEEFDKKKSELLDL